MTEMIPTHYTADEGGYWLEWPYPKIGIEKTILNGTPPKNGTYAEKHIICGNITVHSLAFDDPTKANDGYRRWDCVNGWTKK